MGSNAEPLATTGAMCRTRPFLEPLAFAMLEEIRAYFQDPENEAEFQRWQAKRAGAAPEGAAESTQAQEVERACLRRNGQAMLGKGA